MLYAKVLEEEWERKNSLNLKSANWVGSELAFASPDIPMFLLFVAVIILKPGNAEQLLCAWSLWVRSSNRTPWSKLSVVHKTAVSTGKIHRLGAGILYKFTHIGLASGLW